MKQGSESKDRRLAVPAGNSKLSSMIEEIEVGVKKVYYEWLLADKGEFTAKIDKVIGMS